MSYFILASPSIESWIFPLFSLHWSVCISLLSLEKALICTYILVILSVPRIYNLMGAKQSLSVPYLIIFLQDIGTICKELPSLAVLNLSYNLMAKEIVGLPQLRNIRTLVLNNTGVNWTQVFFLLESSLSIYWVFFCKWCQIFDQLH